MPKILSNIKQPCLFWLDAHYSGGITTKSELETPIMQELHHIFNNSRINKIQHVILIDDSNLFVGDKDYPKLEELKNFVYNSSPNLTLTVKYDVIRIHRNINH